MTYNIDLDLHQEKYGGLMTITEMLSQSAILTLLGMGVVFAFLIIMIFCMGIMRKVISALKLDRDNTEQAGTPTVSSSKETNSIIAAIATALHDKKTN